MTEDKLEIHNKHLMKPKMGDLWFKKVNDERVLDCVIVDVTEYYVTVARDRCRNAAGNMAWNMNTIANALKTDFQKEFGDPHKFEVVPHVPQPLKRNFSRRPRAI